jgi:hypothetical protein
MKLVYQLTFTTDEDLLLGDAETIEEQIREALDYHGMESILLDLKLVSSDPDE